MAPLNKLYEDTNTALIPSCTSSRCMFSIIFLLIYYLLLRTLESNLCILMVMSEKTFRKAVSFRVATNV